MAERCVSALLVGAGMRGQGYASYALAYPESLKITAVAEWRDDVRKTFSQLHQIDEEFMFKDWKDAVGKDKCADCVIIAHTARHDEPAIAFAKKGYHVLVEHPMAVTEQDCKQLYQVAMETDVIFSVCHVLRYAPQTKLVKEMIEAGRIGDVVNIQLIEKVGYCFASHMFGRRYWAKQRSSAITVLGKSGHDLDLICYWMGESKCKKVSCFGTRSHFNAKSKPTIATARCLDCPLKDECPYSGTRVYLQPVLQGVKQSLANFITKDKTRIPDIETVTDALRNTDDGVCIYHDDNDALTHCVINMEFTGGRTANHTFVSFSEKNERIAQIQGTMGEIYCMFGSHTEIYDFRTQKRESFGPGVDMESLPEPLRFYWGADFGVIDSFVKAVQTGDRSYIVTGPVESLESHLLSFTADNARLEGVVKDFTTAT